MKEDTPCLALGTPARTAQFQDRRPEATHQTNESTSPEAQTSHPPHHSLQREAPQLLTAAAEETPSAGRATSATTTTTATHHLQSPTTQHWAPASTRRRVREFLAELRQRATTTHRHGHHEQSNKQGTQKPAQSAGHT